MRFREVTYVLLRNLLDIVYHLFCLLSSSISSLQVCFLLFCLGFGFFSSLPTSFLTFPLPFLSFPSRWDLGLEAGSEQLCGA